MKTSRWAMIVGIFLASLTLLAASVIVFADTQTTYTISASTGANGTITPNGAVVVSAGANQGFTITANSGYHIANVVVDGVYQGVIVNPFAYTFTSVAANHTIAATFANVTTYTITTSAAANGTITPSGAVVVNASANQAFAIAANSGYHIADVLVDGGSVGAVGTYTFTSVAANHTISASFVQTSTPVIDENETDGQNQGDQDGQNQGDQDENQDDQDEHQQGDQGEHHANQGEHQGNHENEE